MRVSQDRAGQGRSGHTGHSSSSSMPELAEVTIRWRGEAQEVKLAGEFNNWEPETITR